AVIPADGGEARVLSDAPCGVATPRWTEAGLFVKWVQWDEDDEVEPEERARRPRHIDATPYRFDGKGWTHDRRHRVTRIDPYGAGDPEHLTPPLRAIDDFAVVGDDIALIVEPERVIGDE